MMQQGGGGGGRRRRRGQAAEAEDRRERRDAADQEHAGPICDQLGIKIPAQDMVATPDKLMAMSQGHHRRTSARSR
jgi:hypothetical protein